MEFLKEIYGDKALTYEEFVQAINAHNGNEANKDKQVKLENINSGNYVSKLKYDDIAQQLTGKQTEIDTANKLIEDMKKATKGNEDLQKKFADYEADNARLQAELQETKIKSAIKVGLLSEGCKDVDYVTYKLMEGLKEKGEKLELDESENVKGWADRVSGLKTQLPAQFESAGDDKMKVLGDNRLPAGDGERKSEPQSLAEALKMQYENN